MLVTRNFESVVCQAYLNVFSLYLLAHCLIITFLIFCSVTLKLNVALPRMTTKVGCFFPNLPFSVFFFPVMEDTIVTIYELIKAFLLLN